MGQATGFVALVIFLLGVLWLPISRFAELLRSVLFSSIWFQMLWHNYVFFLALLLQFCISLCWSHCRNMRMMLDYILLSLVFRYTLMNNLEAYYLSCFLVPVGILEVVLMYFTFSHALSFSCLDREKIYDNRVCCFYPDISQPKPGIMWSTKAIFDEMLYMFSLILLFLTCFLIQKRGSQVMIVWSFCLWFSLSSSWSCSVWVVCCSFCSVDICILFQDFGCCIVSSVGSWCINQERRS